MKEEKCIIYLTATTIKQIDFVSPKIESESGLNLHVPRDIKMTIKVDNSGLDELYGRRVDETGAELPREIDSVRLLFNYAVTSYRSEVSYLDGEVETIDSFTRSITKLSYKNLFVTRFEESFERETRETHIYIHLRERA